MNAGWLIPGVVLFPLVAGLVVLRIASAEGARRLALVAAALSMVCAGMTLLQFLGGGDYAPVRLVIGGQSWLRADLVSAVPMALFSLLLLATVALAPKADMESGPLAGNLLLSAGTLLVYAADHLLLLAAGWMLATLPFLVRRGKRPVLPRLALAGALAALLIAAGLMALDAPGGSLGFDGLRAAKAPGGVWAFGFLVIAALLRKGVFPFHFWVVRALERESLPFTALLVNGHLGAFLIARLGMPLFPDSAGRSLFLLSNLALFTAAYSALMAFTERNPRARLGLLLVSQASFILVGLESGTPEAVTGALLHWLVVGWATTGLVGIYSAVEARLGPIGPDGFLGLSGRTPRLAVGFLVCGLALVGLPGTLGFCAEDLLLHGTLETHPWVGYLLPVASAMNAFVLFRLYSQIFTGKRSPHLASVADALPRERLALSALVVLLVAGGLMPRLLAVHGYGAGQKMAQGPAELRTSRR